MTPINIHSQPCACPPDFCAHFGCATACVHRLPGVVRTDLCPVCAPGHTWHQDGACLKCRALAEPAAPCSCWFCTDLGPK